MKKIVGRVIHSLGLGLSALAMWIDPSKGREHIKPSKVAVKMFNLGGFLEGRGNEYMTGWR